MHITGPFTSISSEQQCNPSNGQKLPALLHYASSNTIDRRARICVLQANQGQLKSLHCLKWS